MQTAYICADSGVPVFGTKGCSIHVQEVLRAMKHAGAELTLFAARVEKVPPADLRDIPVWQYPPVGGGTREERERAALDANRILRSALETQLENWKRAGDAASVPGQGAGDGLSKRLVYERYSLWSYAGMEFACEHRLPGVLEVNAPLIEEQLEHRGLTDEIKARDVAERVFAAAGAIVAVSAEVANYLESYSEARGKTFVIPNGVNPGRFPKLLVPRCPSFGFTVGFLGSLKPWHGLSVLIDAFAILHRNCPGARLLIVGDGPEREKLMAQLADNGLREAAYFAGAVDPVDVPGWLASMDVAVAPYPDSRKFYFSPLKIYEYMAASRAIVASRLGQIADVISHGVNGWLVPPGDVSSLADALLKLSSMPHLRQRLGRAAFDHVRENYSWDSAVRRIFQIAAHTRPATAISPIPLEC